VRGAESASVVASTSTDASTSAAAHRSTPRIAEQAEVHRQLLLAHVLGEALDSDAYGLMLLHCAVVDVGLVAHLRVVEALARDRSGSDGANVARLRSSANTPSKGRSSGHALLAVADDEAEVGVGEPHLGAMGTFTATLSGAGFLLLNILIEFYYFFVGTPTVRTNINSVNRLLNGQFIIHFC
jgi:hypothetical protein